MTSLVIFCVEQETAYDVSISDGSSYLCSSVLLSRAAGIGASSSGSPVASACACSTSRRTPCIEERVYSVVMVDSSATTSTSSRWRSACSVHAASLPPLHASSTGVRMLLRGRAVGDGERKSVGDGKNVSCRVDLAGRRL